MHVKSIGAFEHQTWNPLCEDENGCKVHAARSWSGRTEKGAAARRVCVFFLTFFQAEPGRYQKSMIRRSNCILRWLSLADNELGHPCGSLAAAFDSTLHLCVCGTLDFAIHKVKGAVNWRERGGECFFPCLACSGGLICCYLRGGHCPIPPHSEVSSLQFGRHRCQGPLCSRPKFAQGRKSREALHSTQQCWQKMMPACFLRGLELPECPEFTSDLGCGTFSGLKNGFGGSSACGRNSAWQWIPSAAAWCPVVDGLLEDAWGLIYSEDPDFKLWRSAFDIYAAANSCANWPCWYLAKPQIISNLSTHHIGVQQLPGQYFSWRVNRKGLKSKAIKKDLLSGHST